MQHWRRIIEALGVKIIEVPDLPSKVALVRNQGVALIRADLDPASLEWVADWLLQQAARLECPHR